MLKMLIADDERVIRETISHLIDWNALGIQVTGLCRNGLEAYDMIQDEAPDIVLTDINMPGLSGLELIRRVLSVSADTQFVILSGYDDFDYARQAMHLGIKHYLLKPCSEQEIVEVMEDVKRECMRHRMREVQQQSNTLMLRRLHESVMQNLLRACMQKAPDFTAAEEQYEQFLSFTRVGYELCSVECALPQVQDETTGAFVRYHQAHAPQTPYFCVWTDSCCLLLFESYDYDYTMLDAEMRTLCNSHGRYSRTSFSCLNELLPELQRRMERAQVVTFGLDRQPPARQAGAVEHFLDDPVEKVKEYVRTHLDEEDLSLKKISETVLYMNVNYVSHRFKEKTSARFSAFLAEERVHRAKELFDTGQTSISAVAAEVGCRNNPQYFSQLFKKVAGVTPSDYLHKQA